MAAYKRNQVEDAISKAFLSALDAHLDLRTKLKRLLDTDRKLGRNMRSRDPLHSTFAFFSEASPGSGFEVEFSAYEAFALMTALRFLEHGWPQQSAVQILRQARDELQREHARILKLDPSVVFDEASIHDSVRPGRLDSGSKEESFLVVISREATDRGDPSWSRSARICRGERELMPAIRGGGAGQAATFMTLTRAAFVLQAALDETVPSKRGRVAM